MSSIDVIILAGGKGSRMGPGKPKPLRELGGRPLVHHVLSTVRALQPDNVYIVNNPENSVAAEIKEMEDFHGMNIHYVPQYTAGGTGHAVRVVLESKDDGATAYQPHADRQTVILYGDVPLVQCDTLQTLINASRSAGVGVITAYIDPPTGYGRIIRNSTGDIAAIVEQKDATEEQKQITEINTGIYCVRNDLLAKWIPAIAPNAITGEYYLTDIVAMASDCEDNTIKVTSLPEPLSGDDIYQIQGINTLEELAHLEAYLGRSSGTS